MYTQGLLVSCFFKDERQTKLVNRVLVQSEFYTHVLILYKSFSCGLNDRLNPELFSHRTRNNVNTKRPARGANGWSQCEANYPFGGENGFRVRVRTPSKVPFLVHKDASLQPSPQRRCSNKHRESSQHSPPRVKITISCRDLGWWGVGRCSSVGIDPTTYFTVVVWNK